MSSFVLQQKWVNFQSKALKSLGGGRLSHLSASCQVTKFVAVYTHIWATPNSSYLCSTVLKTNTILGSNFLYLLSVAPCSPMYKIGGEIWFLLVKILHVKQYFWHQVMCNKLEVLRKGREGKDPTETFAPSYLGLRRDLKLLGPCCKSFVVKNSVIQWDKLITDYRIQVVKLKHKWIKQSFFNLSGSFHRSGNDLQDRVETQSWQEVVGSSIISVLCREAVGEGTGAKRSLGPLPSAGQGNGISRNGKITSVLLQICERLCTESDLTDSLCCLYCFPSPASAAVRAQDEDGADASNGRTDTSSSNSVSISNSISSCEVSKIVRSL